MQLKISPLPPSLGKSHRLAARLGLEPRLNGPEPFVLPLHHRALMEDFYSNPVFYFIKRGLAVVFAKFINYFLDGLFFDGFCKIIIHSGINTIFPVSCHCISWHGDNNNRCFFPFFLFLPSHQSRSFPASGNP
jgi:hypothetical protein